MGRSANEQAFRRYVEAKNRHDVDAALAACADDYRYETAGLGVIAGKERARAFYEALFASLPDYRGEFDDELWGEDAVVSWGRFGGTTAGDLLGLPAQQGRAVSVPVAFVCTFRDGLLATDTGYFDMAALVAQAGIPLARVRPSPGADFLERFAEFWAEPDPDSVSDLVDPGVVATFPGAGRIEGADAYREQIAAALAVAPDLRLEVLDHLADGDVVMIEWRGRGTVAGEPVVLEGTDRFRLRDGRVVDARVVYDTGPLRDAMGQPPVTRTPAPASRPRTRASRRPRTRRSTRA
jgi:steroid delta-isomerase-like uncharacterized protein